MRATNLPFTNWHDDKGSVSGNALTVSDGSFSTKTCRYHSRQGRRGRAVHPRSRAISGAKTRSTATLSKEQREEPLKALKECFEKNMKRHEGL